MTTAAEPWRRRRSNTLWWLVLGFGVFVAAKHGVEGKWAVAGAVALVVVMQLMGRRR